MEISGIKQFRKLAGESCIDSPVLYLYNEFMAITLELNNQTKSPVKKAFFNAVARETLKEFNLDLPRNYNISLSVALVNAKEIKRLNKTYRRKNQVTDVLSFAEYKNAKAVKTVVDKPPKGESGEIFLGELILCYDYIKEYAEKRKINPRTKNLRAKRFGAGVKLKKELANVVSHGVLHLLGMRHGRKMFEIQDGVIKKF